MPIDKISDGDLLVQKLEALAAASQAKQASLQARTQQEVVIPHHSNPVLDTLGDIGIKTAQGVVDLGQSVVGLGSLATGGLIGKGMRELGYDPAATNEFLGQYLSESQRAADQKVADAKGFKDTLLASLQNPRAIMGSVVESLPGMVAGMGVTGAVARNIGLKAAMATIEGSTAAEAAIKAGQSAAQASEAAIATTAGRTAAQQAIEAAKNKLLLVGAAGEGAQSSGQIADQAQAAGRDYTDYALPAIAAGVGTGAINLAAGRLMGDAATDIATGTHTLKGSTIAKIAKEGFSEGVLEEMPQSAQEQIFTNVAMGEQDLTKGVGEAAASGLLAGAAMGAGFGGIHHTGDVTQAKKVAAAERLQAYQAAVQSNDPTIFQAEESAQYNPTLAAGVIFQNAIRQDATPQSQIEDLQKVTQLMAEVTDRKGKLEQAVKAGDKSAQSQLKEIQSHSDKVGAIWDQISQRVEASMSPEAAQNDVQLATSPAEQGSNEAAQRVVTLSMANTSHLTAEDAVKVADTQDNGLTDEQRSYLRTFSQTRQLENQLQTMSTTSRQIYTGEQKPGGNVGIAQYRQRIGAALAVGNQNVASYQLGLLENFATSHEGKAAALAEAVKMGAGSQVQKNDQTGEWFAVPATDRKSLLGKTKLKENGGLAVDEVVAKTANLAKNIATEAKALRSAHDEMSQAAALRFQEAPTQTAQPSVQSETPTPAPSATQLVPPGSPAASAENTAPQGKLLLEENGKDEARLKTESLESVAMEPQNGEVRGNTLKNIPRVQVGQNANSFTNVNAQAARDQADMLNLTGLIEDHFAAGKTVNQVRADMQDELKAIPKDEQAAFIIGTRATLGIPSQDTTEGKAEFLAWKKEYDARKQAESAPLSPTSPPASPASQPSAPIAVADAPAQGTAASLASAGDPLAQSQPVATEQPAAVSAANPAPAAEVATAAGKPASVLSVMQSYVSGFKGNMQEIFNKILTGEMNLVAQFLTQEPISERYKTQRPLASMPDFLSSWLNNETSVSQFVQGELTEKQDTALRHFKNTAASWLPKLRSNFDNQFKGSAEFKIQDLMQSLYFTGLDGQVDIDENIKTAMAYAGYEKILSMIRSPATLTDESINAMHGRDKDAKVPEQLRERIASVSGFEDAFISDIGAVAAQALGLKARKNAPADILPRLQSALGTHIMALLEQEGMIERRFVEKALIDTYLSKDDDAADQASIIEGQISQVEAGQMARPKHLQTMYTYVALARNPDGSLTDQARSFNDSNGGAGSILDKLFSAELAPTFAYTSPQEFRQQTAKRTDREVPELQRRVIQDMQDTPHRLIGDMWYLLQGIGRDALLRVAGHQEVTNERVHKVNRDGTKARNENLESQFDLMADMISQAIANGDDPLEQDWYVGGSVGRNFRAYITTRSLNTQTSKIHRFMFSRPQWTVTLDMQNAELVNQFKVAIGAAFGQKTDKKVNATTLAGFDAFMADDKNADLRAAIDTIQRGVFEGDATAFHQQAVDTIEKAASSREGMQTLQAMVAWAKYDWAKRNGGANPEISMLVGVDGKTNGPMLTFLALGAGTSVEELYTTLRRGGFYPEGSEEAKHFSEWYAQQGQDLYEDFARNVLAAVNEKVDTAENIAAMKKAKDKAAYSRFTLNQLAAFEVISKELSDPKTGAVSKHGRDLVKTPITALGFGSSMGGASRSMQDRFIENIYGTIEDMAGGVREVAGQRTTPELLVQALNELMLMVDYKAPAIGKMGQEQLMEFELSQAQEKLLRKAFDRIMGSNVKTAMRGYFGTFMDRRTVLNNTIQGVYSAYARAYGELKTSMVEAMMDKGEVASRTDSNGKRVPLHDLTAEQEKVLDDRLKALLPVVNTAYTVADNNLAAGLYMAKSEQVAQRTPMYKNEVMLKNGIKNSKGKLSTKFQTSSVRTEESSPGVAGAAYFIHSDDSANMHMAMAEVPGSHNVHDEIGNGIGAHLASAQAINKHTVTNLLAFSPAREAVKTLERQMVAMTKLAKAGTLSQGVVARMYEDWAAALNRNVPEEDHIAPSEAGAILVAQSVHNAYKADQMRLGAIAQMAVVDQYTWEDGQFQVTPEIRAEAAKQLAALTDVVPKKLEQAIAYLDQVYAGKKGVETAVPSWVNEVGTALAQGDEMPAAPVQPVLDAIATEAVGPEAAPKAAQALASSGFTAYGELGMPAIQSDARLVQELASRGSTTASEIAGFLEGIIGANDQFSNYKRKLLRMVLKVVGDINIHFVTSTTPAELLIGDAADKSRGWYATSDQAHAIYVLSPEFKYSGLTDETLLHELVHAAVARTILAVQNGEAVSQEAKDMVANLEGLLAQVKDKVAAAGLQDQFGAAVGSVNELVAWGMSNQAFQDQVLKQITGVRDTKTNTILDGLKAFVRTLATILGLGNQYNGLYVLLNNTTGLMAEASKNKSRATAVLSMAAAAPMDYTTEQIYDALGQLGTGAVNPAFDDHLRDLLKSITGATAGPFQAFKAAALQNTPTTPLGLWAAAKTANVVPFASEALASGFRFTEQEAFALDQVEATVRAVLQDKEGSTTAAYRELTQLYQDAREQVQPGSLPAGLHDFVFKMELGANNESDYLSRFAALGLANQQFNAALQFATPIRTKDLTGLSFGQKLAAMFENMLTWIHGKLTHTYEGQGANEKLTTLVQQLVDIEQRKRLKLASTPAVMLNAIEDAFRNTAEKGRNAIQKVGQHPFFQSSTNGFTKLAGTTMHMLAGNKLDGWMNALQQYRDDHIHEQNGILMGIVNEIRGGTDGNKVMHKLLRLSKEIEGRRKDIITGTSKLSLSGFEDGGSYLEDADKQALSQVALRGDLAALLDPATGFDMAQLHQIVTDEASRDHMIDNYEQQLMHGPHAHERINGARILGLYLATGEVGGANLRMNAQAIADMVGTQQFGRIGQAEGAHAAAILDPLVSLYALAYQDEAHRQQLGAIMARENARQDGNGVELVLKMHKHLQADSKARLFDGAGYLAMKGYVPEAFNPYIDMVTAQEGSAEAKDLIAQGYVEGARVTMDHADPNHRVGTRIYTLRDGGLLRYQTGVVSFTGLGRKGSSVHNDNLNLLSTTGQMNMHTMALIQRGQQANLQLQGQALIDPTRNIHNSNFLAPVINANGEVMNYRYLMNRDTKDNLLERDNRFDHLLGVMAGSIFDKEETAKQNRVAVKALFEQYRAEFGQKPRSFTMVGPNSPDPELREVWRLMPDTMKQAVREEWGTDHMMVRFDLLDVTFGYRKMSITDPFTKPDAERNRFEQEFVGAMETLMGRKAKVYLRRAEDIWQALVAYAKDTMVVKSGVTLLGNFTSNVSELIWFGVPLTDMWRHHRVALKGVMAYRKDSQELNRLQNLLAIDHLGSMSRGDAQREIVRLKDALARNPVRELIDAGMMPTIVEDVSADEDQYSFEARFDRKVDEWVDKLNPSVVKAAKFVTMAHDTEIYKGLHFMTQVSDFLARYTLYQHLLGREQDPMNKEDALHLVSEAFVTYDVPSHRGMQYANDSGLVYFSKYYLRIQKVIALLYRQNPGRALMLLTAGHFLDFIPMLTHSSVLHRFGNPFSTGAFEAVGTLDEMATIKALMTPFR